MAKRKLIPVKRLAEIESMLAAIEHAVESLADELDPERRGGDSVSHRGLIVRELEAVSRAAGRGSRLARYAINEQTGV